MSNKQVWIKWKDATGECLTFLVNALSEDSMVVHLQMEFVKQQQLVGVSPAALEVRETENGTKLRVDERLSSYFIVPPTEAGTSGPGRAYETPLVLTIRPAGPSAAGPQLGWDFSHIDTSGFSRRTHEFPPSNEPQIWIGREQAENQIRKVAYRNFLSRTSVDHARFAFLVASGHVRSGKTRAGIETPRIVEKLCNDVSAAEGQSSPTFAAPVYLKIDFLHREQFNSLFDVKSLSASEALGARLISSFYDGVPLKKIAHDIALEHVISSIRSGRLADSIVPIVVHIDEHGTFISNWDEHHQDDGGKEYFQKMLRLLGSIATSSDGRLGSLHRAGCFFIIPITTGTSHSAANINIITTYGIAPVTLPALTFEQAIELARSCLEMRGMEQGRIEEILADLNFRIALGDTGGLPGLVDFLCIFNPFANGISFVQHLQNETSIYVSESKWDNRWASVTSAFFARPSVSEETVLMSEYRLPGSLTRYAKIEDMKEVKGGSVIVPERIDYSVQDALDGGTIFLGLSEAGTKEIRLAPALLAKFNGRRGLFNAILTKGISRAENWTWIDFEKAHLLYLAATMSALIREQNRFDEVTLGTFLRSVSPAGSPLLSEKLILESCFNGADYQEDSWQCIPKSNASAERRVSVDLVDFQHVHLAKEGTPIIDGYQNLKFLSPSGHGAKVRSMFLQYKHSGLESRTSDVHVSTMNAEVIKLKSRLMKHGWSTEHEFIFLWVTNRRVERDVMPCRELLWVERCALAEHAPLLGTRGLVPLEELRQGE